MKELLKVQPLEELLKVQLQVKELLKMKLQVKVILLGRMLIVKLLKRIL